MSLGERIRKARQAKKLTQAKLAEKIGVSNEAVSSWERGAYEPSPENLAALEEILHLSAFDEDGEPRDLRLFDEEHMSAFLKGRLGAAFSEARKAVDYAKKMHAGQMRKPVEAGIPYVNHPLTMACHALAMGLRDDVLLASLLLHDVAEDCGVAAEDLPFSEEVRHVVALVTKPPKPYSEDAYFEGVRSDPKACLVKCIDRVNNLSGMAAAFSPEWIAAYVAETAKYYPALLRIVKEQPEYNDAAWLLQYQMRGLLDTAKAAK